MIKKLFILLVFILSFSVISETYGAEASLFLSPNSGEYQIGSTFSVKVRVNSNGAPINAAEAKVLFPQEFLEVRSASKTGSIFKLWPEEPVFSNSKGDVSFKGGVPGGFTGQGTIFSINFRAKKVGEAKVSLSEAKVLAADGRGTDILSFTQGATFLIIEAPPVPKVPSPPKIFSSTHPNEDFWYPNPNPEFQWEIPSDITAVSYKFDQSPSSAAEIVLEEVINSKSFKKVEDGIWYFHLRVKNKFGWSKISHYKIQIDTIPPHPFDVIIDNQGDPTNPRPFLYFEAKDDLSGISHYEIKIGEEDIISLTLIQINPFQIPLQTPGSYKVLVKAVDRAGNSRESLALFTIESIPAPKILVYSKVYKPGEELFYVEGTAPEDLTVIIYLKKDGKIIKTWETKSDENGNWSFSTDELLKSDNYLISARSRDKRGAISYPSPEYKVKVILAGISIGPLIITYQNLFFILIILIVIFGTIIIFVILSKMKKIKKETREAAESLENTFDDLKKKITKRIEYFDARPGLSPKEKVIRDEFMEILEKSEKTVSKEIQDIDKAL